MPKKHDIDFAKSEFEKQGMLLLETVYKNTKTPMRCVCICGKETYKQLNHVQLGQKCRDCGYKYRDVGKISYAHVREVFEKSGYTLLSNDYEGIKIPLEYECPEGHTGKISLYNFESMGQRCRSCYLERNQGETHPRYNQDLTAEQRVSRRNIPELREWYLAIKERDKYTCVCCGDNRGGNLNSHHLYSYADYPDKRFDMDNGVTLCKKCHLDFHGSYGYGGNTKEQFIDFLRNRERASC